MKLRFAKKCIVVVAGLFSISHLGSTLIEATAEPSKVPFKIGAILPLTGPMAFAGAEVRDAMNLALSEVTSRQYAFQISFEDNGSGPAATASAANRLISEMQVNAIVSLWPEAANVVAPISERRNVLHYTIAWDPAIACSHKLILSHQAMVTDYAKATLELLKARQLKSIDFFHDSVFQQGADTLQRFAGDYQISIRKIYTFDRGKSDFRSELASSPPNQAVLIWSIMPETEIFLKQLREAKKAGFVTGFFDVVQNLSLIEGFPFASEVHSTAKFQKDFSARFSRPAIMKGPNAYDIVHLLAQTVEALPRPLPSALQIKEELIKVRNYSGAVGDIMISVERRMVAQSRGRVDMTAHHQRLNSTL